MTILEGRVNLHIAIGHFCQRLCGFNRQFDHVQIIVSRQRCLILRPPDADATTAVGQQHHASRPPAGFAKLAFVGQANIDPAFDIAGEVFQPKCRLVISRKAAPVSECFICKHRKGQQAHHHSLTGLGWMAREHEGMVAVIAAIHVRNSQVHLMDRGL